MTDDLAAEGDRRGPLDLDGPTICDMNCFYQPGHDGPHQAHAGDPCTKCGKPMFSAVKQPDGWYHKACLA